LETGRRNIKTDLINTLCALDCKIYKDELLSRRSSFKIGGAADYFMEIPNEKALREFLKYAQKNNTRYFLAGCATNVLFSDEGYRGVVIRLTGDFERLEIKDCEISCGGSVSLAVALKVALDNNLSGLECVSGIPGTAGAAVFGNAGGKDLWISRAVKSVEVYRGVKKKLINKEKIDFGYRKSGLEGCIITKVNFSLKKEERNDILKEVLESIQKRSEAQPLSVPNAGCIFKNPPGISAGKLIDEAGLKGVCRGAAKISEKHANFIINTGGAKSADVKELIAFIRKTVEDKFGIRLETEIKIV
jgi:UDP-N-acetylmuramate dehydrogenase